MKTYKFFFTTHKWSGIILSAPFISTSVTGFLLLIKKKADWIQPPTIKGAAGEFDDFISVQQVFSAVLAQGHPDFASEDDIDRIDFRPAKRVFKVQSAHHHTEIQVCAITGDVLSTAYRTSDLIENIHDGSFFGEWVHGWVMPVSAGGILFLVFSGIWLWIEPKVRRRRRAKRAEADRSLGSKDLDC